ncbi:hypothetical protein [Sphingomonas soli]|uniref:hypothetical protein n=1 Tax=Sphingomonas soli TaxID=266127 RepID=UPI00082E03C1|nr:hypothetical protein [Sphingomonas soli]
MRLILAAATFVLASPAAAQLNPNAGPVTGEGVLNDHDGNSGTWKLSATLSGGAFTGTLDMVLGGKPMSVTLKNAFHENGNCIVKGENGRNRFELSGKCSPTRFGPGTISGYFDRDRSFNGEFSGTLRWGKAAAKPAATGIVPTAKLMCAYRERVGGNVAGDLPTYQSRPSSMVSLTLAGGTYRTRNASGAYTVSGNRIRLTSGFYAGAVGELRADNSGAPAVYFNLEENRRANGVPIVDPWSTACATQN